MMRGTWGFPRRPLMHDRTVGCVGNAAQHTDHPDLRGALRDTVRQGAVEGHIRGTAPSQTDGSATLRDQRAFIFTKNRPRSLLPSRASITAAGYLHRTDRVSCRGGRTAPGDVIRRRTWSARGRRAAVLVTLPAPPAWSRPRLAGVSLRWEQSAKRRLERRRTSHGRCRMTVCGLLSGGGGGWQVLMVADVRGQAFWLVGGRAGCRAAPAGSWRRIHGECRAANAFAQVKGMSADICKTVG